MFFVSRAPLGVGREICKDTPGVSTRARVACHICSLAARAIAKGARLGDMFAKEFTASREQESLAEWSRRWFQARACRVSDLFSLAARAIAKGARFGDMFMKEFFSSCKQDSLAEWSKALASGASPQGRGFEPHSCHFHTPSKYETLC